LGAKPGLALPCMENNSKPNTSSKRTKSAIGSPTWHAHVFKIYKIQAKKPISNRELNLARSCVQNQSNPKRKPHQQSGAKPSTLSYLRTCQPTVMHCHGLAWLRTAIHNVTLKSRELLCPMTCDQIAC